jgi:hypothetical protein
MGEGTIIGAAKTRFKKKQNEYAIESYKHGTECNRLLTVRRLK